MTRIRDQRILSFAANTVWATDIGTRTAILSILARHYNGVRLTQTEIEEATRGGRSRPNSQEGGAIAVLPLWGVLAPHAGTMVDISTEATGLDDWVAKLKALAADPQVGTILLRVNSPGGSAMGAEEAAKAVREARSQKTVVAVADTLAASAAYLIASQADTLIVTPSGMVGAVHCYTIHEDISGMLEQAGVTITLIGEPDGGSAESPAFLPLSDENRAHAEAMVSRFYDSFVKNVAAGRGVSVSEVEKSYGRGRVLTSEAALAAGMVDGIASFDDTLARLAAGKPVGGPRQHTELPPDPISTAAATLPGAASLVSDIAANVTQLSGLRYATGGVDFTSTSGGDSSFSLTTTGAEAPAPIGGRSSNEGGTTMDSVIDGRPPTIEELAAQRTHIEAEMNDLVAQAAGRAFTTEEQARFDEFEAAVQEIDKITENHNNRTARMAALAADPEKRITGVGIPKDLGGVYTNAGRKGPQDVFDLAAYRAFASSVDDLAPLWRDGAKRANEIAAYRTAHLDETRAFVAALLDQDVSILAKDSFSHRMLIAANPAYEAAFGRWVMGRESNADMGMVRMAVTNTGLGAETPVPVAIDPTVLYSGDGSRSPLRQISQVVTITGLKWRGLSSDGVSMAYGAEASTFSPGTPSFDAPDVDVVKAKGEIQFTVEVDDDWTTLRSELQRLFGIAQRNLEADKFLNGTGTNEPTGLIWALDDDGTSVVDTETANSIVWSDITGLSDELPPSFDANASWLAHKKFYTLAEALAVEEGYQNGWVGPGRGFQAPTGAVGVLHGDPAYTASAISTGFTTGNEEVAVIGNFAEGFVIIDRIGLNVELDPHPRDTNGAWTGHRALLCWFRNNTALRTPNAFRLLRVKHT